MEVDSDSERGGFVLGAEEGVNAGSSDGRGVSSVMD
jgi:hypothetical protein